MRQLRFQISILALAISVLTTGFASAELVVLNEYNAVRADRWLDVDGAANSTATDTFFGRIVGNGGRWFEMLVVGETALANETIDMRGWTFDWTSSDVGNGSFTLSTDARLSSIHRGSLVTFFSQDAGGGNVGSSFDSYDPYAGDWWLNINLADAALIASGTLNTGNGDWQLTVKDALDTVLFGPSGEGVGSLAGVNSREVGKLEQYAAGDANNTLANWQAITPLSGVYSDGTSSTFGGANLWTGGTLTQDFSPLRNVTAVPEPATVSALFILATGVVGARYRRNRKS